MARVYRRLLTRRMAPKRIWQAVLAGVLLVAFYLLLPAPEVATARAWLETMLGRFR
jgi:uncharacterized MnhB-related membrane protein